MPWKNEPPILKLLRDISDKFSPYVDFSQKSLLYAALAIAFNPIFWNITARLEHRTHFLTRIFRSPYYGCYFLALVIFSLGISRDLLYERALRQQPMHPLLSNPLLNTYGAYALLALGNTLVLSSMWALGLTGTYLGDYFGILMDAPVTGFPFNVTGSPMYWGSCCSFLGSALLYGRPVGVLLTGEVWLMYILALRWEDPFTAGIYKKRDRERELARRGEKKNK